MPKRKFELPGIQDLSKEQEAARLLPKDGQHLIVGGPGTGKSVLALIRARRHHRDGDSYLFLVFNHLLSRASGQLFGDSLAGKTWQSWFFETFRTTVGKPVPRKQRSESGFRDIDWPGVEEIVNALPNHENLQNPPFLVIDEGQDMPREFYETLVKLGFNRFFVVADQNQQITESNSSRKDIQDCLALEASDVIELRQNYRNGFQVARLANAFYTGDPASPPPELPAASPGPAPILYSYDGDSLSAVARGILLLADRDPRQLIGIIAPSNRVRERYLKALHSADVQLDNARPQIQTFHKECRADVAFDEGGILVINAQACKGLEFDTVVLADIDEHFMRRTDPDGAKRLFYVMVARARERVFMFIKREGCRDIQRILPTDPDLLRREQMQ